MSEVKELPEGWSFATLQECSRRITDGTHQPPGFVQEGIPFIFVHHIVGGVISFENTKFISQKIYQELHARCPVELGDILYSAVGSYGVAVPVKIDRPFSFQRHIAHIKPSLLLSPDYLAYFLNSPEGRSQAHEVARGVAQKTVTLGDLARFKIPIAPLAEQQRIVAAIEQQFTRLDAGVAALTSAQTRLKRYRAAVLKAAVEGKLTEAWRAEHPETEPASVLLQRILAERRARWEADLRAKGKDPAKVRYEEPAGPDTTDLPELPEGWCWVTVEQLGDANEQAVLTGPFGSNLGREDFIDSGVPVLTIGCLTNQGLSLDKAFYVSAAKASELERYRVKPGDMLFSRMASVGRAEMVSEKFEGALINYHLMRLRLTDQAINPHYFVSYVRGSGTVSDYVREVNHGATRDGINTSQLLTLPLSLPPRTEQEQIVAEIERRLSVVSELEAIVEANLKRAERLRQSILREAFAGRLVPQEPNDEPASVLLERIWRERETHAGNNGKARKNGREESIPDSRLDERPIQVQAEQASLWNE